MGWVFKINFFSVDLFIFIFFSLGLNFYLRKWMYMAYCGYAENLIVVIFGTLFFLLIVVLFLRIIFVRDHGIIIVRSKIIRFFFCGDLEILRRIWGLLFLIIVIFIRSSVMIFSCSYIRGLVVGNFVLLYVGFVIRIAWLVLSNNFYWIILG